MNPALNNINLDTSPTVFSINESGEVIEIPQNTEGEYEYDLNVMAIEAITELCDNYQMRANHMDFNWKRTIAQTHIQMIISYLFENL